MPSYSTTTKDRLLRRYAHARLVWRSISPQRRGRSVAISRTSTEPLLAQYDLVLLCIYCTGTLGENEVRTTLLREGDASYCDPVETQSWPTDLHSVVVTARLSRPRPAHPSCQSVWTQACVSQYGVRCFSCYATCVCCSLEAVSRPAPRTLPGTSSLSSQTRCCMQGRGARIDL